MNMVIEEKYGSVAKIFFSYFKTIIGVPLYTIISGDGSD